jgi:predicted permease
MAAAGERFAAPHPVLLTFLTVSPVFALIAAGWLARRAGAMGPHATAELNRFVVSLALPAVLFNIAAHAKGVEVWQPGFIAAFGLGSLIVFFAVIAWRLRGSGHLADAAIDGLNAAYANTGFIGFPLALVALGRPSLAAVTIATIFTVCGVFSLAIVLIEFGLAPAAGRRHVLSKVGWALAKNPLLIAPLAGALVSWSALTIPAPAQSFLDLLGSAAAPTALVMIGLFLAEPRKNGESPPRGYVTLVVAKLLAQPALTCALAALVFHLPPELTRSATLLAALPTGTGSFMLAEFYRREATSTSRAILVSTVLSVVTVSGYLAMS